MTLTHSMLRASRQKRTVALTRSAVMGLWLLGAITLNGAVAETVTLNSEGSLTAAGPDEPSFPQDTVRLSAPRAAPPGMVQERAETVDRTSGTALLEVSEPEVSEQIGPMNSAQTKQPAIADTSNGVAATASLVRDEAAPLGRSVYARAQPLDITAPISVTQIILLDQSIPTGSILSLGPYQAVGAWYQMIDSAAPNFVVLEASVRDHWQYLPDTKAGITGSQLQFQLIGPTLPPATRFEIGYKNLTRHKSALAPLSLPVTIKRPEDDAPQRLVSEVRETVAGPATVIHLDLPGSVGVGQAFDLHGTLTDRYGHISASTVSSLDLIINNKLHSEIAVDNSTFDEQLVLDEPGEYRFLARSPGGGLKSDEIFIQVIDQPEAQLLWTDFTASSINRWLKILPERAVPEKVVPDGLSRADPPRSTLEFSPETLQSLAQLGATDVKMKHHEVTSEMPNGISAAPLVESPRDELYETGREVSDTLPRAPTRLQTNTEAINLEVTPIPEAALTQTQVLGPAARSFVTRSYAGVSSGDQAGSLSTAATAELPGLYSDFAPIQSGGQTSTLIEGQDPLLIGHPESTSDRRLHKLSLVQQLVGASGHQWFTERIAELGNTLGVVSTRDSFSPRAGGTSPVTGLWVHKGQDWLSALRLGQTFVSSGARAGLTFSINGTRFGRAQNSPLRDLKLSVESDIPPLWARIYRNGEVLQQLAFDASDPAIATASTSERNVSETTGRLYLYVASDSKPRAPGITEPRNGREWLGRISIDHARLISANAPQLIKIEGNGLRYDTNSGHVDFLTWTHGLGSLIGIDVRIPPLNTPEASKVIVDNDERSREPDVEIESPRVTLNIAEGFEDLTFSDLGRLSVPTPAFQESFILKDLLGQGIQRMLRVDGYEDEIHLWYQSIDDIAADTEGNDSSRTFTAALIDQSDTRPGDYYTAQILLQDGSQLFTSPIFVGGFQSAKADRPVHNAL